MPAPVTFTGEATGSGHDVVALARTLLRHRSVTPEDDGALGALGAILSALGFVVTPLAFGPPGATTPNLFARLGTEGPHLCFAGHTDVVPPGDGWVRDPFGGQIEGGVLHGRGAVDMKGAIAAFVAAVAGLLAERSLRGSVSLLLTGDEEGPALHGTRDVLGWMADHGQRPDFCLVGEPTSVGALGDVIKIGRRGSLNATITMRGTQGHVAYPDRARNPLPPLLDLLHALTHEALDDGTERFQPSVLQVTSVDTGNPSSNVIPGVATARLNIRFNDRHTGAGLTRWLEDKAALHAPGAVVESAVSGEAFLTAPGGPVALLSEAVEAVTGLPPRLDTGGGTSDARFIARFCPVAEFGLVGTTMHRNDEGVALDDLGRLERVYRVFLERFGL